MPCRISWPSSVAKTDSHCKHWSGAPRPACLCCLPLRRMQTLLATQDARLRMAVSAGGLPASTGRALQVLDKLLLGDEVGAPCWQGG